MTWDGQMHRCSLCSGKRDCGHVNQVGRQQICTRDKGHADDHAEYDRHPGVYQLEFETAMARTMLRRIAQGIIKIKGMK